LHIEERGAGPALVLGHGFGGSARNFRPQARAFSDRFRVVLYDARGHARSEAPEDPTEYEPRCFVEDLLRVVDGTGEERVVVGGLSMGAGVALRFALAHPARVRGLVLAAIPRSAEDESQRRWALSFADAIDEHGVDAAGADFVWATRSRFDPDGARLIRQGFLEHPAHGLSNTLRHLLAEEPDADSFREQLSRFDLPVLLVVGSEDAHSLEASHELSRVLPDAELVVIEGAGHVVNLADVDAFNSALGRFLEQLDNS
jgi:pimeloyl-ACP methyl ester carboxylesterase